MRVEPHLDKYRPFRHVALKPHTLGRGLLQRAASIQRTVARPFRPGLPGHRIGVVVNTISQQPTSQTKTTQMTTIFGSPTVTALARLMK